jgi:opacity protein-like surface antigen
MKRLVLIASIAGAVLFPTKSHSQLPPVQERLGFRSGYIQTLDQLEDSFGGGGHVTLWFTERVHDQLYFDFRVAAIYLGNLKNPNITVRFANSPGVPPEDIESEMRVLFFSVGPQYVIPLAEYWNAYLSAGAGVYSVSMLFDSGIAAGDYSDQHFGVNAGGGAQWRFTETWNLDFNFTLHHFWTRKKTSDLYYFFTDQGDSSPYLLQFATGVSIDLR